MDLIFEKIVICNFIYVIQMTENTMIMIYSFTSLRKSLDQNTQ